MSDADAIALFDLDGSLADYELALRRDLGKIFSGPLGNLWAEEKEDSGLRAAMDLIRRQPRWWATLPIISAGMTIWRLAQELGFDCQVLTKGPKRHPSAWQEKVEWCQHHFGADVDVHVVSDKKLCYGRVLYDDYPDYMARWLEHRPRGLGIMPVTPYNVDFEHPNVIKWDGKNYDEVRAALEKAMARRPGEPPQP